MFEIDVVYFFLHLPARNELSSLLLRSVKLFCSLYEVSGEIIKYLLASFLFFFFLTAEIGHRGMKFCTNTFLKILGKQL